MLDKMLIWSNNYYVLWLQYNKMSDDYDRDGDDCDGYDGNNDDYDEVSK